MNHRKIKINDHLMCNIPIRIRQLNLFKIYKFLFLKFFLTGSIDYFKDAVAGNIQILNFSLFLFGFFCFTKTDIKNSEEFTNRTILLFRRKYLTIGKVNLDQI